MICKLSSFQVNWQKYLTPVWKWKVNLCKSHKIVCGVQVSMQCNINIIESWWLTVLLNDTLDKWWNIKLFDIISYCVSTLCCITECPSHEAEFNRVLGLAMWSLHGEYYLLYYIKCDISMFLKMVCPCHCFGIAVYSWPLVKLLWSIFIFLFVSLFNFVFSFCVFICSSYGLLHCLARLLDWTHFHFLGTVLTYPHSYWMNDWIHEWMNEITRNPIRVMASCLAGTSGGERGVLLYVGVPFGCASMLTRFMPCMFTVHVPIF